MQTELPIKTEEQEFKEWTANLLRNGFKPIEVDCEVCEGDGEYTCGHCGNGMIQCEECDGNGKVFFPTIDDYRTFKKQEEKLLEMWKAGTPIHATMTFKSDLLPWFLVDGQIEHKFDHGNLDTRNPFTIHMIARKA